MGIHKMKNRASSGSEIMLGITIVIVWLLMLLLLRSEIRADDGDQPKAPPCHAVCFAYGCPPPPPCLSAEFTHSVFVPRADNRSIPYPLPDFIPGEESFLATNISERIDMGGAPGSGNEYMDATTLVTVLDATQDPAAVLVCWYGQWPNGAGAARCDRY